MDPLIARFDGQADGDLVVCAHRGVAYQADPALRIAYDDDYFDRFAGYAGQEIERRLMAARVALVDEHVGADAQVCDVGVGSGAFIRARPNTVGVDVCPKAVGMLQRKGLWLERLEEVRAFTFWDVIEHLDAPDHYFKRIPQGSHLFASLPVFEDLARVRASKHYKPGEHLTYWTADGFVRWMAEYRFRLLEARDDETRAGRDGIASFAFVRDLPGYHDTLAQYAELHAGAYGTSGSMYLDLVAAEVLPLQPQSLLDYGCGRSDLAAHFWLDGHRRIARYDPAIPAFKEPPAGQFDLVLCTDVMEHIRMQDVDRVLAEIHAWSRRALFTISLRPARRRLPDGRNAHVTLLTAHEWARWIKSVFGRAFAVPTGQDHLLMLKTWK